MEFNEVVQRRRMVRRYRADRKVPRPVLDALLRTAVQAPSAGFSQGWHFLVLDDPAAVSAYWAATVEASRPVDRWLEGMRSAPALMVVFSDRSAYEDRYRRSDKLARSHAPLDLERRWPVPYWHLDAAMAALLVLLAAVDAELGACFFGVPASRVEDLREAFGVPVGLVPVATISLGYPEAAQTPPKPRTRRDLAEVVSYSRFGSSA